MDDLYQRIDIWIENLSRGMVQPNDLRAVYVGIFASDPHYQLYMVGSNEYDSEDDDWACQEDWGVDLPYLDTGISSVDLPWTTMQEAVIHALELLTEKKHDTILQWDVAVATGFDDGDLVHIKEC